MAKKQHDPNINESKVELAKTIAQRSERIVRSYNNIENFLAKAWSWLSSWFDKILFNQRYGKEVALILAIIIYIAMNSTEVLKIANNAGSYRDYDGLPVTVEVNSSVYEVSGVPQVANLTLKGDMTDIMVADSQANQKIVVDLTGLGEGTHTVDLKATNVSNKLETVIEPSTAVVTLKKKVSYPFTIGYDFINTNKMSNIYALDAPDFDMDQVIVRASEDTINSISVVKALIDVTNVSGDFSLEAPLVAYDQQGNRLNVDISPEKVVANVKVTTPSKDVPIVVKPVGEIPNNLAISSYTMDNTAVTVNGPQDALDALDEIVVEVPMYNFDLDLNGEASITRTVNLPINLPSGIRKKSVTSVSITFEFVEKSEKTIDDVVITYRNHTSGYKVTIDENEPQTVSVLLEGAANVLEAEDGTNIKAYVDLADLSETGTISVPLHVEGPNDLIKYSLSVDSIKINVAK